MVAELPPSPAELAAGWIGSLTGTWWFCHTSPRLIERLSRDIEAAGAVPVNLKTTHIVRRETASGRRYNDTVQVPLFPGYLFFNGEPGHRILAKEGPVKPQVHDVRDQAKLARELAHLVRAIAVCPNLGTSKLKVGHWVRIISGPLIGLQGYVLDSKPHIVHLSLSTLGGAVDAEVDPATVELV